MNGLIAEFTLDQGDFRLNTRIEGPARGVLGVFGPSGSGKTTLLRCLAGLEKHARGYLRVGELLWHNDAQRIFVPPHKRAIGYVFQDGRLFPHLSVHDNLQFGARRSSQAHDPSVWQRTVELLGIGHLLQRHPHNLSGGEQQRVAIGRALLRQPRLLLMDEPMASLDAQRKAEILPYLEALHQELSIPLVYVTHSVGEIVHLADHLILMSNGEIRAAGALLDILPRLDLPLAHTADASVALETTVADHEPRYQLTRLRFDGGELSVTQHDAAIGGKVRVLIQARDVSLACSRATDSSVLNILEATIEDIAHESGGRTLVRMRAGSAPLLARITRKSFDRMQLMPGMRIYAQIKSIALSN